MIHLFHNRFYINLLQFSKKTVMKCFLLVSYIHVVSSNLKIGRIWGNPLRTDESILETNQTTVSVEIQLTRIRVIWCHDFLENSRKCFLLIVYYCFSHSVKYSKVDLFEWILLENGDIITNKSKLEINPTSISEKIWWKMFSFEEKMEPSSSVKSLKIEKRKRIFVTLSSYNHL